MLFQTTSSVSESAAPAPPVAVFIERLARALHRFGLPSHRIEEALERVAGRLGVAGQFFATPTAVFASLDDGADTRTVLMRMDPGEVNLDKLSRLDALLDAVVTGTMDLSRATSTVDEIAQAPARYGVRLTTAAFAVASATAARFFGGGWREVVTCSVIGLLAAVFAILAQRLPARQRKFEPAAALAAGFLAVAAAAIIRPLSPAVAMCAGLIVLIPGLTLTISINEFATRNLVAGTVRMMGALVLFLEIGFGVAVGMKLASLVVPAGVALEPSPLPPWTLAAALVLAPLSFTVLFQASWRDAGWIIAAGALAFAGARIGAQAFGPELGAFTGALLVGAGSNLHARLLRRPASVTLVPGIMLLVPGSVGFQSVSSLIAHDVVSGMETAFLMSVLGIALVSGLLLANAVVPPRRAL